ncbi:MAG: tRNA guanosine(34) transglycosylase Tgt [bacterium]|nr:tRNA guanosine(34) transglycosylase Tgt [bacterium]
METAFHFDITKKSLHSKARRGRFHTPHGVIETPAFVTVGTNASVKALSSEDVLEAGSQVVLANAYHLLLGGRTEVVEKAGGLHTFMNWQGPMMTDSGGFQVFSLGFGKDHKVGRNTTLFPGEGSSSEMRARDVYTPSDIKILEEGVIFRLLSGERMSLTPEKSIAIQERLGADIIFAFDECTSPLSGYDYQKEAMGRTHRWAERSRNAHTRKDQALFGIIQGGEWQDLREESVKAISALDFSGFGMGGYFGKTKEKMYELLNFVTERLPEQKPRHHLGIGRPEDIPKLIDAGIDMFDCAAPTREARNGTLYVSNGTISIGNGEFREDFKPTEEGCGCVACSNFTRAYLHHLIRGKELLYYRLASIHNLYFVNNLVREIRERI